MAVNNLSSTTSSTTAAGATPSAASLLASTAPSTAAETEDRFLTLLVAQMQNQDPLNPVDNAQVTTQMAQIQTVTGLDTINKTVSGLNAQFAQLQALSGASLVGRGVLVDGNRMVVEDGTGRAGFELLTPADQVKLEVLDSAGRVIDTETLDAMPTGRHGFNWTPPTGVSADQAATFRVTATLGTAPVSSVPLMHDRIATVAQGIDGLHPRTGQRRSLHLRADPRFRLT